MSLRREVTIRPAGRVARLSMACGWKHQVVEGISTAFTEAVERFEHKRRTNAGLTCFECSDPACRMTTLEVLPDAGKSVAIFRVGGHYADHAIGRDPGKLRKRAERKFLGKVVAA